WIEHDTEVDLLALSRGDDPAVRRMAVFDAVVNNADRKIGHLLPIRSGHVYGCDHGVCFSAEYKLRTVLWQWRVRRHPPPPPPPPEPVPPRRGRRRASPGAGSARRLPALLTGEEIEAIHGRIELMPNHRTPPSPPEDWPAIPWPPL